MAAAEPPPQHGTPAYGGPGGEGGQCQGLVRAFGKPTAQGWAGPGALLAVPGSWPRRPMDGEISQAVSGVAGCAGCAQAKAARGSKGPVVPFAGVRLAVGPGGAEPRHD